MSLQNKLLGYYKVRYAWPSPLDSYPVIPKNYWYPPGIEFGTNVPQLNNQYGCDYDPVEQAFKINLPSGIVNEYPVSNCIINRKLKSFTFTIGLKGKFYKHPRNGVISSSYWAKVISIRPDIFFGQPSRSGGYWNPNKNILSVFVNNVEYKTNYTGNELTYITLIIDSFGYVKIYNNKRLISNEFNQLLANEQNIGYLLPPMGIIKIWGGGNNGGLIHDPLYFSHLGVWGRPLLHDEVSHVIDANNDIVGLVPLESDSQGVWSLVDFNDISGKDRHLIAPYNDFNQQYILTIKNDIKYNINRNNCFFISFRFATNDNTWNTILEFGGCRVEQRDGDLIIFKHINNNDIAIIRVSTFFEGITDRNIIISFNHKTIHIYADTIKYSFPVNWVGLDPIVRQNLNANGVFSTNWVMFDNITNLKLFVKETASSPQKLSNVGIWSRYPTYDDLTTLIFNQLPNVQTLSLNDNLVGLYKFTEPNNVVLDYSSRHKNLEYNYNSGYKSNVPNGIELVGNSEIRNDNFNFLNTTMDPGGVYAENYQTTVFISFAGGTHNNVGVEKNILNLFSNFISIKKTYNGCSFYAHGQQFASHTDIFGGFTNIFIKLNSSKRTARVIYNGSDLGSFSVAPKNNSNISINSQLILGNSYVPPPILNGLQAFYKLNDLTDASGNGNTLTNVGGVNFGSGKIGNGAIFNANGAGGKYLATSVLGGLGSGLTVSMWAKANTFVEGSLIQAVAGDQNGWFIGFDNGNKRLYYLAGNGSWSVADHFGSPLDNDTWYHIVKRADASGVKIYINGTQVGSWTNVTWTSAPIPIELGHYAYHNGSRDESWNGSIDAVGIWNRALTEAEITDLYNFGIGLELDGLTLGGGNGLDLQLYTVGIWDRLLNDREVTKLNNNQQIFKDFGLVLENTNQGDYLYTPLNTFNVRLKSNSKFKGNTYIVGF